MELSHQAQGSVGRSPLLGWEVQSYGSEVSESITAELKYLVYAEGNFKRGSTLNLSVTKGTYTLSEGLIFVANAADDLSAANHYKVDKKDAKIESFSFLLDFEDASVEDAIINWKKEYFG